MKMQKQVSLIADQCSAEFGTTNIHKVLNAPLNADLNILKASAKKYVQKARQGIYPQCLIGIMDKISALLKNPVKFINYILLPQVRAEYMANEKIINNRMRSKSKLISKVRQLTSKCERQQKELEANKELIAIKDKLLDFYQFLNRAPKNSEPPNSPEFSRARARINSSPLPECTSVKAVEVTLDNFVYDYGDGDEQQQRPTQLEELKLKPKQTKDAQVQVDLEKQEKDLEVMMLKKELENGRKLFNHLEEKLQNQSSKLIEVQKMFDSAQVQLELNERTEDSLRRKKQEVNELLSLNESLNDRIASMEGQVVEMQVKMKEKTDNFTLLILSLTFVLLIFFITASWSW